MIKLFPQMQESPIILRDGNGTIYPMAKDCMGGIRDPDWLDLPPISSLRMSQIQTFLLISKLENQK